jgi:single-strand DNA-binding protein
VIISTVTGRLCADAELRQVGSDSLLTFTLASDNKPKNVNGEQQKTTTFVNGKIWGKRGENVAQYFTKGKKIMAAGELENRKWSTAEKNGESLDLNVNTFEFLDSGQQHSEDNAEPKVTSKPNPNYSKPTAAPIKSTTPPSGGTATLIKPLEAVSSPEVPITDPFEFD